MQLSSEIKKLIKPNINGILYIKESDIFKLNLNSKERRQIVSLLLSNGIKVEYDSRVSINHHAKISNYEDTLSKGFDKKPRLATIKYDNAGLEIYDFSKLDLYIENILIPTKVESKVLNQQEINYIKLLNIIRSNFNHEEIEYIFNYLNQKGIMVSGNSRMFIEYENYLYVPSTSHNNLHNLPSLDPIEQEKLFKEYEKTKDLKIRNKLVEGNMRLVFHVLKILQISSTSQDFEMLLSYGYEGLIVAVERYNLNLEIKFATFACKYIKGYILRGISIQTGIVGDFYHEYQSAKKIVEQEYNQKLEDNLDLVDKVLEYIYINNSHDIRYYNHYKNRILLSIPVTLTEEIEAKCLISDENLSLGVDLDLLNTKLNQLLSILSDRELKILNLYYGSKLTLQQIGDLENVKRQRISEILKRIFKKINKSIYKKELLKLYYSELLEIIYDDPKVLIK